MYQNANERIEKNGATWAQSFVNKSFVASTPYSYVETVS
jgi:hypothetical protein